MSSSLSSSDEVAKAQQAAASAPPEANVPTIFDKLLNGTIPATVVYEDDQTFCFRDVQPQAPVHILCIPKHKDGLTGLSAAKTERHKEVLGHLLFVASQVAQKECPNGYRIVINDGGDGCQSVFHLHLHILGGRQMGWPPG